MPEMTAVSPRGVRVLIVDDSPVARDVLKSVLESDVEITVVGMAATGTEAVELTARLRPDLVTMDLVMPGMDGMEATQRIMARHPTPILFLSAFIGREGVYSRADALAAGALDIVEKPMPLSDVRAEGAAAALRRRVKSLAQVPVITHMYGAGAARMTARAPQAVGDAALVAIGASTGGPRVLGELLAALPAGYGLPIVVVQHMAEGYVDTLVESLRHQGRLEVALAQNGDRLRAGRVHIAPPESHLTVQKGGRLAVETGPPVRGFRPSIDVTFSSVARVYGGRAAGILLTGMGVDGAAGLREIRVAGGPTLVQDEASSVVFGMPRAAIERGAAQHVLPPAGMLRHMMSWHAAARRRREQ
jgi:two-component system chemotaxis response regulator CheB